MQLVRFRYKGLRQLHEDGNVRGVPSAMADKLRKLLLALETAETLEQLGRFPGWKLHPLKGDLERIMEPDCHRKLAVDFPLRRTDEYRQRY
jgi:toxin HigB-1